LTTNGSNGQRGHDSTDDSSDPPERKWTRAQVWKFARKGLVHPLFPVTVFILCSVFLYKIDPGSKGEFYPFSNYPMYANPRNRDLEYFFLQHGNGEPLASFKYTGYSAARVKKLMRSASMAWAKNNGRQWNKKSSWLDDEVRAEIAITVLAQLRKRSLDRATPFPGDIALARGLIFVNEQGKLEDTATTIAKNKDEAGDEEKPPSSPQP
jgi:hypothetical protein